MTNSECAAVLRTKALAYTDGETFRALLDQAAKVLEAADMRAQWTYQSGQRGSDWTCSHCGGKLPKPRRFCPDCGFLMAENPSNPTGLDESEGGDDD